MRSLILSLSIIVLLTPLIASAIEPINEPHAMVYYQIPLGASNPEQRQHSFGLRMDRTSHEPGQMIEYQQIFKKPAMFNFKMGYRGIKALNISGIDYLKKYRTNRANGDEGEEIALEDESMDESMDEEITEGEEMVGEEVAEEEVVEEEYEEITEDTGPTIGEFLDSVDLMYLL